jgi:hypothetical protein
MQWPEGNKWGIRGWMGGWMETSISVEIYVNELANGQWGHFSDRIGMDVMKRRVRKIQIPCLPFVQNEWMIEWIKF